MSYDYLMFYQPGFRPQWLKRLTLLTKGEIASMGTPEEIMERITAILPSITWHSYEQKELSSALRLINGSKVDPDAPVWHGRGGPEFQLSADVDGNVKHMIVSNVTPKELRRLRRSLGFVSLDLQKESLLGMLFH